MPIIASEISVFPQNLLSPGEDNFSGLPDSAQWWVLHTKSRQEKSLARDLLCRSIAFYLPLVPKRLIVRGSVVRSHIPLFSSYVFVCCTPEERMAALSTKRVANALHVEDECQLRHDLKQVKCLIEAGAPLTIESRLQANQRVRIRSGAMQGLEGLVCRRKSESRLIVWIKMLQQGVSLELDDCLLEPID